MLRNGSEWFRLHLQVYKCGLMFHAAGSDTRTRVWVMSDVDTGKTSEVNMEVRKCIVLEFGDLFGRVRVACTVAMTSRKLLRWWIPNNYFCRYLQHCLLRGRRQNCIRHQCFRLAIPQVRSI